MTLRERLEQVQVKLHAANAAIGLAVESPEAVNLASVNDALMEARRELESALREAEPPFIKCHYACDGLCGVTHNMAKREAEPPPPQTVCKCGHGVGVHTHNLRNKPKQYRHDCSHCACEAFRTREAAPPVAQEALIRCRDCGRYNSPNTTDCACGATVCLRPCCQPVAQEAATNRSWQDAGSIPATVQSRVAQRQSGREAEDASSNLAGATRSSVRIERRGNGEGAAMPSRLNRNQPAPVLRVTTAEGAHHQHAGEVNGRKDGECPTCGEEER